ncbi:MAG: single-stranded-DNA-specific exonuclease RecJ [Cyanobacteria bacterium J06638_22]
MSDLPAVTWQLRPCEAVPQEFVAAVQGYLADSDGTRAAQLLWQRGIRTIAQLQAFVDPQQYQPTSACAFGEEMEGAIARLQQALEKEEAIAIWGDFDADGVTATAVLWDGLGQFFQPDQTLFYTIPNRFTESHGLAIAGIDRLAEQGIRLIITCDTGSTNLAEIVHAQQRGIDVIVTDHHTLPTERPDVTALINPRRFPADHPLATLSGVAVAYKFVEAVYDRLAPILPTPPRSLETLLDLVAIGLIADLVELRGDCRYLAQIGIQRLKKNAEVDPPRPGVAKLLELCRRTGDRPTDISFGIGPRINAISRIHGDARFAVELLTSQDEERCAALAQETELANSRRKGLQRDVTRQVEERLETLDLSTTFAIVLADEQWSPGVLGLVAAQIAQTYGRPTILFTIEAGIARGSARSLHNLDLYRVLAAQSHLLHSFGGHPYAAGMSLPIENLPLFAEALNRQLREENVGVTDMLSPVVEADLQVTVAELGRSLFRELNLLEPYGMGNPIPRLLLRNVRFERAWHRNIKDFVQQTVRYICTTFELRDDTGTRFDGVWWGHYKEELPAGECDAIVELDYNPRKAVDSKHNGQGYEVRLIAVRPAIAPTASLPSTARTDWLLDWRTTRPEPPPTDVLKMDRLPSQWEDFYPWFRQAQQAEQMLAIAYPSPTDASAIDIWRQLVGIAKYLSRTGKPVRRAQLLERLEVGDRTLQLGFQALQALGFTVTRQDNTLQFEVQPVVEMPESDSLQPFLDAVEEERFRQRYFYAVPFSTIQAMASRR